MKTKPIILFSVFSFLLCACNQPKKEKKVELYEPSRPAVVNKIDRGKQLVNMIGCHDCHSPKIFTATGMTLDENRLLSGHPSNEKLPKYDAATAKSYILFTMGGTASIGPWGTSYGANLTSDDTGIGTWSESQFLNAIQNGKYKGLDGSRDMLPLMPWEYYKNMPEEDLKAIYAYLKTVKPIVNVVPAAIINTPPL